MAPNAGAQATWNRSHYSDFHFLDFNYHPTEVRLSEHFLKAKYAYAGQSVLFPPDSTAHFPMACDETGNMLFYGTERDGFIHNRFGRPLNGMRNGIWADFIDRNFIRKTGFDAYGWSVSPQFYVTGTVSFPIPGKPGIMGILGLTGLAGHRSYSYRMPWAYEPQPTEGLFLYAEVDALADGGTGKVYKQARMIGDKGFCKYAVVKTPDESGYFIYAVTAVQNVSV
jgi:hypothetical protein